MLQPRTTYSFSAIFTPQKRRRKDRIQPFKSIQKQKTEICLIKR